MLRKYPSPRKYPTPRRLFETDPLMNDLTNALNEFLDIEKRYHAYLRVKDLYIGHNINIFRSESDEIEETDVNCQDLVKELAVLLKAAQRTSNKLRAQMIRKSKCGHIHDDFEYLRRLIKRALFPCLHRIRRHHLPCIRNSL